MSRMSPEAHSAVLCLAVLRGSVQMEKAGGCETHTKRQSVLHFPGGGQTAALSSPREQLWPQESSGGWGNPHRFTDLVMPTSNF